MRRKDFRPFYRADLLAVCLAGAALLSACGERTPPPETDSLSAVCADESACVEVAVVAGHGATDGVRVLQNPTLDDEVTRWAACLDVARQCFEGESDVAACLVESGECPDSCTGAFENRYDSAASLSANLDAFEAVFMDDAAICRPGEVWQ